MRTFKYYVTKRKLYSKLISNIRIEYNKLYRAGIDFVDFKSMGALE